MARSFIERPQSNLLTDSIWPRMGELHPDRQFSIGQDSGIYFKHTEPPLDGCRAPDWFYVPGVPPMLGGTFRRSYVLWQELVPPFVLIEYAYGEGTEERDRTPRSGKFWIYEQAIKAKYYAIFDIEAGRVELHHLEQGRYTGVAPNDAGRLPIPELGAEFGIWQGGYRGVSTPWLRFWDATTGRMMPHSGERIEVERRRAEAAIRRTEAAKARIEAIRLQLEALPQTDALRRRTARLNERLRALGIDPEAA
jgi:Uma2 family endonuclease/Fe2+ transport system protein FeoA